MGAVAGAPRRSTAQTGAFCSWPAVAVAVAVGAASPATTEERAGTAARRPAAVAPTAAGSARAVAVRAGAVLRLAGQSGSAAGANDTAGGGGGGGGGYAGGGLGTGGGVGEGAGGGGGAGSSFVESSAIGTPTFATAGTTGSGQVTLSWSAPSTTTTVTASPNPSASGQVTLTATVSPPSGVSSRAPTGSVDFHDDGRFLGSGTLNASNPDQATLTTGVGSLAPGAHTFDADYLGDAVYSGSASNSVTDEVLGSATTSVSFGRNPAIAGQPLTLTATVTPTPPGGPAPTGQVSFCGTPISCGTATLDGKSPDQAAYHTTVKAVGAGTYPITVAYRGDSIYSTFLVGVIKDLPVVVAGPLSVTTASLTNAKVGQHYSATVAATGGVVPYHWSIAGGSLPSGLTLNASTGAITGRPTKPGTTTFTVKVTDSTLPTAKSATKSETVTVAPAPLAITTATLAQARVGSAYTAAFAASGGVTPYHWSIAGGSLPSGLKLNATTGAISGTPTTPGTATFTAKVLDSASPTAVSASRSLTVTVIPTIQPAAFVSNGGNSAVNGFALGASGNVAELRDLGIEHAAVRHRRHRPRPHRAPVRGQLRQQSDRGVRQRDERQRHPERDHLGPGHRPRPTPGGHSRLVRGPVRGQRAGGDDHRLRAGRRWQRDPAADDLWNVDRPLQPRRGDDRPRGRSVGGQLRQQQPDRLRAGRQRQRYSERRISGPATGLDAPEGLTIDGAGNLLVANTFGESLTEYSTTGNGDPAPPRVIAGADTGLDFPDGVDVDSQGNIYVSNQLSNTVKGLAPGASGDAVPESTISGAATGLSSPGPLAVSPPLSVLPRPCRRQGSGGSTPSLSGPRSALLPTSGRWRVASSRQDCICTP